MLKCGTDIIEVNRIKEAIEKIQDSFKKRVFTENEIQYCESKNIQKYQSYSGRFAAKEAIFKALNDIIKDKYKIKWTDLEILNDQNGKPKVKINSNSIDIKKIRNIEISISHCKEYATAICIAEIDK